MKRVTLTIHADNDACEETRDYVFKDTVRVAVGFDGKDKRCWATRYNDSSWTIAIGRMVINDISQETMLDLLNSINNETAKEKANVS